MKNFDLVQFEDSHRLAHTVAARWLKDLGAPSQSWHTVALPGGRIAQSLFSALAQAVTAGNGSLNKVHFFWGDERCVPPTDANSNFSAAHALLLQPLKIPAAQIHRLQAETDEAAARAGAEADLRAFTTANIEGQPVLDLVLLGMGEDGHVASLFPGEPADVMESAAVYRAVTGPEPPPRRLTLGYATLAAAKQVWVLASGTGKEAALRESLSPSGNTPLARLLRLRQQSVIFTELYLPTK